MRVVEVETEEDHAEDGCGDGYWEGVSIGWEIVTLWEIYS